MNELLIVKTAALGDVLRTTSILPGLGRMQPTARITWLTSPAARELVAHNPLVAAVELVESARPDSVQEAMRRLGATSWQRVISLDDEQPLCRLVSGLETERLTGARLDADGRCTYTDDAAVWFEMGLLSRHGKSQADRLKRANERTHPALLAEVVGIDPGQPELHLTQEARAFASGFAQRHGLDVPHSTERTRGTGGRRVVGLNTGAGGRWTGKQLTVERTIELLRALDQALGRSAVLLLFGGPGERERNRAIASGLGELERGAAFVDAGTENPILNFAALVGLCDVLVSSDSLAMHLAIAQGVSVTAFFAPTSAAEIELYGCGEKVLSTAPDYCSYRPDADNSSLTTERLLAATLRCLGCPDGSQSATRVKPGD